MVIETKDFDIFWVPFMFTTSRDLFLRSQPRILIENYRLKEIPFYNISNENFFLAFRIESSSGLMDELKNYFTVDFVILNYNLDRDNSTVDDSIRLPYKNCSDVISGNILRNENKLLYDVSMGYYCIDFQELTDKNVALGGDWR